MEREMDQFMENRQNYMMDNNSMQNLSVASVGDGLVGGVQAEDVSGVAGEILGGKYDEHHEQHDVADDDELKYVEEVQQSEKQQQQQQLHALKNFGLDDDGTHESNELAEKETANNAVHEFGNGNGGFVFGGDHKIYQHQQQHDFFNIGNGHDSNGHTNANVNEDFGNLISSTEFEDKVNMMESELDGFKNEGGDYSSTSNLTESVEGYVPQVDVKIEAKVEPQEILDEEEPSSLATNTTNGTSSLSENIPALSAVTTEANAFNDLMPNLEDKENSDPLTPQRPNDLDLDQGHSQLNPDAKEFVPSFGSNPTSPTSPFSAGLPQNEPVLSDVVETQMYFGQAPSAVPFCTILADEDFVVAESPRKGKNDNNMDAISVPVELSEFELEAAKRPHELEPQGIDDFHRADDVMTPDQPIQQLPLDDVAEQEILIQQPTDLTDFQPSSFMDHGPETCVDLEADVDAQTSTPLLYSLQGEDDVMKRSMYVTSDEAIEDVLNSVQPIPSETDIGNNSFVEESATESAMADLVGDKELLQVEEKEHVSHSPSTEEIQMNLHNYLNSSNKDIPQLPIDNDHIKNLLEEGPEQDVKSQGDNPFEEQISHTNEQQQPTQESEILFQEDHGHANDIVEEVQEQDIKLQSENPFEEEMLQGHHQTTQNSENVFEEKHEHANDMVKEGQEQVIKTQSENTFEEELLQGQQQATQESENLFQEKREYPEEEQVFQKEIQSFKQTEAEFKHFQEQMQSSEEIQNIQETFENGQEPEMRADLDLKEPLESTCTKHQDKLSHQDEKVKQDTITYAHSTEAAEKSLLTGNSMQFDSNDSLLDKPLENSKKEPLQEFNQSLFKQEISDEVSNTLAVESPEIDASINHQELNTNDVDIKSSFTADEKHLLEETKEEQLFSMSGLAQQMSEMMLNNTDNNISQAEEITDTTATAAIEEISENIITSDEAIEHEEHQHHRNFLTGWQDTSRQDQMLVDDSFNRYEKECEQFAEEMEQEIELQETNAETRMEMDKESMESPVEQKDTELMESESVVVAAEPILECTEAAPLFTNEETEIVTRIEERQKEELPVCMVPEPIASAVLLEPPMTTHNETEIGKKEEKLMSQLVAEVAKTETVVDVEQAPVEEAKSKEEVEVKEEEITPDVPMEAAIVAASAVVGATTAVAKVASSTSIKSKTETAKKPVSKATAAAKPKVSAATAATAPTAKKPVEAAKKPVGLAAKPRVGLAKPAPSTTDKKPISKTTTTTATAARKPLSGPPTTASKVVAKTSTTTTRVAATAPKTSTTSTKSTTAPRTALSSTTAARKPAATNGPLAKPRPTSAPAKPTTLGLSATNGAPKAKPVSSPRATLTSQVRKTTPTANATKSPGVTKTSSTTLASRTKTTTSTVSITTGTVAKTFTARPAPKFTSTSTTTTTRRVTVGGSTAATTTNTTTKSSSSPLRKSSPTKPTTGRTPVKAATTAAALKSKSPAKPAASPGKPAPIRKPVDPSIALVNGGEPDAKKQLIENEKMATSAGEHHDHASTQNGDLQGVQLEQIGDFSIPMQAEKQQQQAHLEPTMDLINA